MAWAFVVWLWASLTLPALTALSATAGLATSCGFSFSGISEPRSKEQPDSAIAANANASGRCRGRHDRAKPGSRKGEAIYGSLALLPHVPRPRKGTATK